MFNIGDYLKKFVELSSNNALLKDAVEMAVFDIVGIRLEKKDITIKEKKAIIKTRPIIKNEIAMKKTKILENLSSKAPDKIKDIILS